MIIYCTSRNAGPTSMGVDPVSLVYLGTSLDSAIEEVGTFAQYEREESQWPHLLPKVHSALSRQNLEMTPIKWYMAEGWWYSIVSFEIEDPEVKLPDKQKMVEIITPIVSDFVDQQDVWGPAAQLVQDIAEAVVERTKLALSQ